MMSEKLSGMVWTQATKTCDLFCNIIAAKRASWMAMLRVWPLTNQTSLSWDKPKGCCWRLRKDQKSVVTQLVTTCFVKTRFAAMLQNKLQVTVHITWVPETSTETFQARLPLVASAYDRSFVGLRPTPKIPAAREKNLWYPGYRTQFSQMNPRMFAPQPRTHSPCRLCSGETRNGFL